MDGKGIGRGRVGGREGARGGRQKIEEMREVMGGEGGWVRLGWALPILAKLSWKGPCSARLGFAE